VNEIPLIFRKEIYATVCLAGGGLYLLLEQTNLQADFQIIITIAFIIAIRILVVVKNWSLPSLK